MPSTVHILLFATAREAAGAGQLEWPVPSVGVTVLALLDELRTRFPALAPVLKTSRLVRNGSYLTGQGGRLRPGDEFAIHPPYSGG